MSYEFDRALKRLGKLFKSENLLPFRRGAEVDFLEQYDGGLASAANAMGRSDQTAKNYKWIWQVFGHNPSRYAPFGVSRLVLLARPLTPRYLLTEFMSSLTICGRPAINYTVNNLKREIASHRFRLNKSRKK